MKIDVDQIDKKREILVFKTNLINMKAVKRVSRILNGFPELITWSVDFEDIDNVLRVIAMNSVSEDNIVNLLIEQGFYCAPLEDLQILES